LIIERRDLQTFLTLEENAILSVDADEGNGELTIKVPVACQKAFNGIFSCENCFIIIILAKKNQLSYPCFAEQKSWLKLAVEFCVENPTGGIQFHSASASPEQSEINLNYLQTCGNNAYTWFPCVYSATELCTWKIEITLLNSSQIAISSGDLIEKVCGDDMQHATTYHYYLSVPTSASNIGLVVGQFEMHVDENMNEIKSYCLPELLPLLKNTTAFIHEVNSITYKVIYYTYLLLSCIFILV
jgi:transcription initiation factor TFIID subunit 2